MLQRFRIGALRSRYPDSRADLLASGLYDSWWYYSVELLPGLVTRGQFPGDLPMLPRLMLRRCEVAGMECLDVGSMEGLIPTLLARRGAGRVVATDFSHDQLGKLDAVRHYHDVDFEFRSVGLLYDLPGSLRRRSFDLINCSGVLYHVLSPIAVLGALRSMLKRDGLMLVSTNVTLDPGPVMDFNAAGRMQTERNTFWYPSVGLFDYMLRYMRLTPIDCLFVPHAAIDSIDGLTFDKPSGYLSVMCRAAAASDEDDWMRLSTTSWEYGGACDWDAADSHPQSSIAYTNEEPGDFDLTTAVAERPAVPTHVEEQDSHVLRLTASS